MIFCADYRKDLDLGVRIYYAHQVRTQKRSIFVSTPQMKEASRTIRMII